MAFRIIRRVILKGEEQTRTSEHAADTLRIGRGTSNDLHLEDFSVSFNQALIERIGGAYVLRDLTALSTTYLNQAPVHEATVGHGDTVRIGPYTLRLAREGDGPLTITVEEAEARAQAREKVALLPQYQLSTGRWTKTTLSLVAAGGLLLVVSMVLAFGTHQVLMPGSVSMKHAMFGKDCLRCHLPWKPVWLSVPDKTCKVCHDGPAHFGDRAVAAAPQCSSCHVEHQGRPALASMPDSACIQCHGALQSKNPKVQVAAGIHRFSSDHPEFAVSVPEPEGTLKRVRLDDAANLADRATLKLNHKVHLDPSLMGPNGPEPLTCAGCHQPDARGAYMLPVTYEQNCKRCHLLDFDTRLGGRTALHGKQPEEVHRDLVAAYAEYYFLTHQEELRGRVLVKRLPNAPKTKEEKITEENTIRAEAILYSPKTKKCLLCHEIAFPKGTGPGAARRASRRSRSPRCPSSGSRTVSSTMRRTTRSSRRKAAWRAMRRRRRASRPRTSCCPSATSAGAATATPSARARSASPATTTMTRASRGRASIPTSSRISIRSCAPRSA